MRRAAATCLAASAAVAFAASGAPGPAAAASSFGKVTTVQAPKGHTMRGAVLADVDLDGGPDLVLALRRGGKRDGRVLRVHLRRPGDAAFRNEPDAELDLPGDVVAYGVADLDPEPGAEVALFAPTSVWVWRTRAKEERRLEKVLDGEFLWQLPDEKDVLPWEGSFRDLDGDGRTDLLLPEPGAYRAALRRADGAGFRPPTVLRVPEDAGGEPVESMGARRMRARAERKRLSIALRFGGDAGDSARDLLEVTETVPAPQTVDFDGDGRTDVVAQTPHQLHVWRQRPGGGFGEDPDASFDLPVAADRKRRLDVSYSAHVADLDGDRRTDCVVFGGAPRKDDLRTQVLVYVQSRDASAASPLFGEDGAPRQVLVLDGFAGEPRLVDVDGDGARDLVAGAMRLDALDAVAAATKGTLDAELYVFRNVRGRLAEEPAFRLSLALRAEGLRKGRAGLLARFVDDLSGDGVRELLLRDDPTRLRLLLVRRSGGDLEAHTEPLFETTLPEDAQVLVPEVGGKTSEVLVLEDGQVRHVRFR